MPPKNVIEYYYASSIRTGVLCWYPFDRNARVLDKSNRALTALLKERCAYVTEQSGSAEGTFDYIVVLDPVDFTVDALKALRLQLNTHGRLLMAYENPFALRYWSGKNSPYTGFPYDSLVPGDGRVGKAELTMRLKKAGFAGQKWYYPLTDHWFAHEVYSEAYPPNEYLNQRFLPYIYDDLHLQFDECALYREVIRGGAFPFMCGAYLVEARSCAEDAPCPVDYAAVTAYRETAKQFATTLRADGKVHKIPLHTDGRESLLRILRNHEDMARLGVHVLPVTLEDEQLVMARLNLPTLWDYWAFKLNEGTFCTDEMIGHFDRIRASIYQASRDGKCYWEMVPANCFYDKQKDDLIFFDQEYYWEGVTPDIAVVRALWSLKYSAALRADPRAESWLETLKARYGLTESWNALAEYADKQTCEWVFGGDMRPLELETQKALLRIADRNRYYRFFPAAERIKDKGFRRPAIYGYGLRGKALAQILQAQELIIPAIFDRQFSQSITLEEMISPSSADVLIVSIRGGEDIASDLRGKVNIPVYTLEMLMDGNA